MFDLKFYEFIKSKLNRKTAAEKIFDLKFYKFTNSKLDLKNDKSWKKHFQKKGWREGLDPSPFFNTKAYLRSNPDVAQEGVNPLDHYVSFGQKEGRPVRLSNWGTNLEHELSNKQLEVCLPWIDADFIRAANRSLSEFGNRSVAAWFMTVGWRQGADPSARFSVLFYMSENDDVASTGVNPLLHFVERGQFEGRPPRQMKANLIHVETSFREGVQANLTDTQDEAPLPVTGVSDGLVNDLNAVRHEFDAGFYRRTYEDVSGDDGSLLLHFMQFGWKEGRDPSAAFQTKFYLQRYPDIAASESNPFLHYVLFGKKEGRTCSLSNVINLVFDKDAKLELGLPSSVTNVFEGKSARPPRSINADALNIHWVLPDFRAGSGGHMTIFRMVRYLELFGHKNTIWIEDPIFHETENQAWETIIKWFQCVEADVRFVSDALYQTSGDVVIATEWSTAFTVKQLSGFKARMYFVQDHEPEFYPTGSASNLAKMSYDFDLGCICASPWLEALMSDRYGRWARGFYLAYETDQYFVKDRPEPSKNEPLKIAVYGRARTDRRCVQLALAGLEILAKERQDFEVHLYGQEAMSFKIAPFKAVNHGVLAPEQLNDLYNTCDIGVCFSGTNYSLVPQEMMASGLPLVEFKTDSTEVIFPKGTVSLAGPAPADIAAKIGKLMDDPARRERQRKAALKWVKSFSWRESAQVVETSIKDYLVEKNVKIAAPVVSRKKEILFDVVVPTWNGRQEFGPVLEALRGQHLAEQIQIHCVDSSSTDGTIEWLGKQKDVSLTVIEQSEFQHGRTRNLGASLGSAPFIGFITQDAMPATKYWATDIVKMLRAVPDAAGLFGRHIAYPDHPYFVKEEITNHFQNMLDKPLVLSKHTDTELWESGDLGWRQFLHFYSDNNSAMRRDVWEKIPYPEIDYGEDQVWARDIIEAGYSKLYAPSATVYHSHDYDPEQTYKRSKTEGAFFYEHFGYELGKGTEAEISQSIAREQGNMEAWGRSNNIGTGEIEMRKANIAEKYRGWRDGRMGNPPH